MGVLDRATTSLAGVKVAPRSGEIIYDNNVGKVSIDAVFPMGTEKWNISNEATRFQPRQVFKEEEIASLAASIKEYGQQTPIVIRRAPASRNANRIAEYGIVNGERRWRAMKMLGLKEILVRLVDADSRTAYRLSIIGDIHNVAHNSLERGQSLIEAEQDMKDELVEFLTAHLPRALEAPLNEAGLERLLKVNPAPPIWMQGVFERAVRTERKPKVTDEDVAGTVGITTKQIQNLTKLTTLEPEFTQALLDERINARHAGALLKLPDKKTRRKLLKIIEDENMSGADAEQWVKDTLEPIKKLAGVWKTKADTPPDLVALLTASLTNLQQAADFLRGNPAPEDKQPLQDLSDKMLVELTELDDLLKSESK